MNPTYQIHYTLVISVTPKHRECYERTSPPRRRDICENYFKRGRYDTFYSDKRRKEIALERIQAIAPKDWNVVLYSPPVRNFHDWREYSKWRRQPINRFIDKLAFLTY